MQREYLSHVMSISVAALSLTSVTVSVALSNKVYHGQWSLPREKWPHSVSFVMKQSLLQLLVSVFFLLVIRHPYSVHQYVNGLFKYGHVEELGNNLTLCSVFWDGYANLDFWNLKKKVSKTSTCQWKYWHSNQLALIPDLKVYFDTFWYLKLCLCLCDILVIKSLCLLKKHQMPLTSHRGESQAMIGYPGKYMGCSRDPCTAETLFTVE